MSLRDSILKAEDLPKERVNEWGQEFFIRCLTGAERDAYEQDVIKDKDGDKWRNVRAKLVVRCAVDAEGNRIFTDLDALALGQKSGAVLDRLYAVAQRVSGMTADSVEEAKKN